MPRLLRTDHLATGQVQGVQVGKTAYRPPNLASDAVPPTVAGTVRWDRFRSESRSLLQDRTFWGVVLVFGCGGGAAAGIFFALYA